MKLGKRVCWIVKSVGMFRVKIKQARERISKRKLNLFVKKHVYRWLKRRRLKKAKIIYEFLKFTKEVWS